MNDDWNTGWDPYQELLQSKANIQELARAYNAHENRIQQLNKAHSHQQEVIQQLMFQNRKLNQLLEIHTNTITKLGTDLELLKVRHTDI